MIQRFQSISVFTKEPYKKILAFPKPKDSEIKKRIMELEKLGVSHVSFTGPLQIAVSYTHLTLPTILLV